MRDARVPLVRVGLSGVVLALAATLAGCGGTPPESPPTGIDGLTVPTPDPDAADFVDEVDNPWFPLAAGDSWTYEAPDGGRVELAVDGTDTIAGVPVTVLRRTSTSASGEVLGERSSSYAQDDAGNVWSFGREVLSGPGESWLAGEDGAEAGLLVPAEPRRGDGWLQQRSSALETRVSVLEVEAPEVALGEPVEALLTEDTPQGEDAEPPVVRAYAPGVGVIRVSDAETDEVLLELVEREAGD